MKSCSKCQIKKPVSDFYTRKSGRQSGYLISQCIACCKKAGKARRYTPEDKSRVLQKKYGITIEQFRLMWWAQDGKCAICEKKLTEDKGRGSATMACVDHCHETGNVRGLLCSNCNRALGLFKDDVDIMQKARQYIARSECRDLFEEVI